MYEQILTLHVAGAVATAVAGGYALYTVWQQFTDTYKISALILGALATFEVVTGTMLAVLSVQISAASVCGRVFLYLSFVATIETLLFSNMRKDSMLFPLRVVASPVMASLTVLFTAVAYGF